MLEKPLRGLVQERAPDWEREVSIDQDAIDAIEDRHREAREAILESAEIRYAQFPTLEFCLRELGVDRS